MRFSLVILLGYFIVTNSAESIPNARQSLGTYTVDRNGITVSGLSSGGAMAVQLHVAFSELFTGVGVFAGIPYYCAKGQFLQTTYCMATPGVVNVDSLIQATEEFANRGGIDPTINMQNDKVYVFHGTADRTVYPGIGEKVIDYYTNYVKPENFLTEMTKTSGHGFPTDGYGVACDTTKSPFINDCGYNGAYEMLNYLYGGNLVRPFGAPGTTTLAGTFYEFDQTQFISGLASSSDMDTIAYAYIPSACVDSGSVCKLHVSLHGCLQGRKWLDDEYAKMTGYNEVAELNNIIVIYPQATSNFLDSNPNGCWDWWGYLDSLFGTSEYTLKSGPQMAAIYKMITHMNIIDSASSTPRTTTLGSGTGSPYNCPYANGFFPIPDYCGPDYLSCVDGIAYVQTCPVGSVFNPIKLYCDDPANVDCISLN